MRLSDLLDPLFLIGLGIFIVTVSCILLYVESRIREQNHNINTLCGMMDLLVRNQDETRKTNQGMHGGLYGGLNEEPNQTTIPNPMVTHHSTKAKETKETKETEEMPALIEVSDDEDEDELHTADEAESDEASENESDDKDTSDESDEDDKDTSDESENEREMDYSESHTQLLSEILDEPFELFDDGEALDIEDTDHLSNLDEDLDEERKERKEIEEIEEALEDRPEELPEEARQKQEIDSKFQLVSSLVPHLTEDLTQKTSADVKNVTDKEGGNSTEGKEVTVEAEKKEKTTDYRKLPVSHLKQLATQKGHPNANKMSKSELLALFV